MSEYVRSVKGIQKTLDFQDAFSKAFERRAQRVAWYSRWLFREEQKRLERYEARMLEEFDNCVIISAQDRDCIKNRHRERIVVVPNGVDFEHFCPRVAARQYDVLFTGNMAYPPNVESAVFLVNEIMPLVWKRLPHARLAIVGATPAERVQRLAGPNVLVTGWVDDISEYYAKASVFVAPMLINTGLQNKLLEAMSMGLPCITSQRANSALGGIPGRDIVVCDGPVEYAEAIADLLNDTAKAAQISESGSRFVRARYSWTGATQPLIEVIERNLGTSDLPTRGDA
jgi:glycosyltransferase involved in cell wall biosynthesis